MAHDMIGLYFAVCNANHLPPWGGLDMLLSTNPIAVAVPAGEEPPVVLDMATTVAVYGKAKAKAQRGEMMPPDWMIDRLDSPCWTPSGADEGFLSLCLSAATRLWPVVGRGSAGRHAQRCGHGLRGD